MADALINKFGRPVKGWSACTNAVHTYSRLSKGNNLFRLQAWNRKTEKPMPQNISSLLRAGALPRAGARGCKSERRNRLMNERVN